MQSDYRWVVQYAVNMLSSEELNDTVCSKYAEFWRVKWYSMQ
jgi:hypothetical protein